MKKSFKRSIAVLLSVLMVSCSMPFTALAAAGEYSPDVQLQFGTFIDADNASTLNDFETLESSTGILMSALYLTALDYSNGSLTLKKDKAATVIDEMEYDELDSDYTYEVGDYFTTTVRLDNIDKLAAAEIALSYSDNIIPAGVAQKDGELAYYTADEDASDVEIEAGAPLNQNGADTFYTGIDDGIVGTLSYVDDEQNIIFVSTTAQDGSDYVDVSSVNTDELVDPETGEYGCKYENKAILATFAFKIVDEGPITFSMAKPNSISGSSYDGAFYIADASEGTSPADYTTYEEKDATGSTKMTFMGKNEYVASSTVTVKFQKEDGTEISSNEYEIGSAIVAPALPTKASDKDYHYTYAWDTTPATTASEDVTYTAVETATKHNYDTEVVTEPTEQNTGLKRYTCSVCNYTYDEEMPKTEHVHSWTEWTYDGNATTSQDGTMSRKCNTCDTTDTKVATGTSKLVMTTFTLVLQSSLTIGFRVPKANISSDFTNVSAEITRGTKSLVAEESEFGTYKNSSGVEYHQVSFSDISPQCMNDDVNAVLYAELDGVKVWGPTYTTSVCTYAYTMLNRYASQTSSVYVKLKTLLVDLLNYGSAAQVYANYKTDELANANLTDTQKEWATQTTPTFTSIKDTQYTKLDGATVTWSNATLTLSDAVVPRFKFIATGENVEDLTVNVTVGTKATYSYSYEEYSENFAVQKDGGYYFSFLGLNANNMSEPLYVTVSKDGKVISDTMVYSVESYAASVPSTSAYAKLKAMTDAMMKYGNAAKAYAG